MKVQNPVDQLKQTADEAFVIPKEFSNKYDNAKMITLLAIGAIAAAAVAAPFLPLTFSAVHVIYGVGVGTFFGLVMIYFDNQRSYPKLIRNKLNRLSQAVEPPFPLLKQWFSQEVQDNADQKSAVLKEFNTYCKTQYRESNDLRLRSIYPRDTSPEEEKSEADSAQDNLKLNQIETPLSVMTNEMMSDFEIDCKVSKVKQFVEDAEFLNDTYKQDREFLEPILDVYRKWLRRFKRVSPDSSLIARAGKWSSKGTPKLRRSASFSFNPQQIRS